MIQSDNFLHKYVYISTSYNRYLYISYLTMIEKYSWKQVTYNSNHSNPKPCPRWGHSTCTIDKEVILFGGYAQSIYMNDLWSFNTETMQWSEIKTKGAIPSPRSNSSTSYDAHNNRIIFFGGGGSNKTRFNSINVLDWQTKTWSQIKYQQNQVIPWERTYHTAQLLYPYLVVYGGEGIADLDDLWVYNFETSLWKEIKFDKQSTRPCGRRFHSSCLIGNQFYVIAGCHTKYRCLNDIYSIDLTQLVNKGETQNLYWTLKSADGNALLSRWGHSSASHDNKIYIFGGRFSTDLNDLLIFDPSKDTLKNLKVSSDSLPKPRRRPSTCFVGNCMLMFGGFNSDYYNDLYYINISQNFLKLQYYSNDLEQDKMSYIKKLLEFKDKSQCECLIKSLEGSYVPCIKNLLEGSLFQKEIVEEFLRKIDGKLTQNQLKDTLRILYLGYGINQILEKFQINMPSTQEERRREKRRNIQEKLLPGVKSLSSVIKHKSGWGIMYLSDDKFWQFIQKNREALKKNVSLVINNQFILESNTHLLSMNSRFFRAIFSNFSKTANKQQELVKLTLPSNNIVLFEILVNFLIYGFVTVPQDMSFESWSELYRFADYFCLTQLKETCSFKLNTLLTERNVNQILDFSRSQGIQNLALSCCKYKINLMLVQEEQMRDEYMKKVYEMNKFEILQKEITNPEPKLYKTKSEITTNSEGEKQNYQTCN